MDYEIELKKIFANNNLMLIDMSDYGRHTSFMTQMNKLTLGRVVSHKWLARILTKASYKG